MLLHVNPKPFVCSFLLIGFGNASPVEKVVVHGTSTAASLVLPNTIVKGSKKFIVLVLEVSTFGTVHGTRIKPLCYCCENLAVPDGTRNSESRIPNIKPYIPLNLEL